MTYTLTFVDCHCNSRRDWELAPVPFNELLILKLYLYTGDEYFISSIVSCGDHTVEKDVGGFTKDDTCAIVKFFLGQEASQEDDDQAFLLAEVMWRESCRNEIVQEFLGNSGGITRITLTASTVWNVAST